MARKHHDPFDPRARAIRLRTLGLSFHLIAIALNISSATAYDWAHDIKPEWIMTRRRVGTQLKRRGTGMILPKTNPVLRQRLLDLRRRGFDVPPSKQADWKTLHRHGILADERRRILNLE